MSMTSLTLASFDDHVLEDRVLVERLVERHVERRRDLLGDPIDVGIRHVERAPDVAHHGLRLHRPEGDDLRDVLAAVLPRDVVDHFAAPPLAEVHVDVGQRHALGIEEALEDQVEVDRIDVGDAHAPRDERAGRGASTRPDRDTFLTRVADEVPDDEEVARVAHLPDHRDLVVETARRTRRSSAAAVRRLRAAAAAPGAARSLRAPRARSTRRA